MPKNPIDAIKSILNESSDLNEGFLTKRFKPSEVLRLDKIDKKVATLPTYEPVDGQMANGGAVSFRSLASSSLRGTTSEMAKRLTGALGAKIGAASIKSSASSAIKRFPVIVSDDIGSDTTMVLKKVFEEQYAEYLSLLVSNTVIDTGEFMSGQAGGKNVALQAIEPMHTNTELTTAGEIKALAGKAASGKLNDTDFMDVTSAFQLLREEFGVTEPDAKSFVENIMANAVICHNLQEAEMVASLMEAEMADETNMLNEARPLPPTPPTPPKPIDPAHQVVIDTNTDAFVDTIRFMDLIKQSYSVVDKCKDIASKLSDSLDQTTFDANYKAKSMAAIYSNIDLFEYTAKPGKTTGATTVFRMPDFQKLADIIVDSLAAMLDASCASDVFMHRYDRHKAAIDAAIGTYGSPEAKHKFNELIAEKDRVFAASKAMQEITTKYLDELLSAFEERVSFYIDGIKKADAPKHSIDPRVFNALKGYISSSKNINYEYVQSDILDVLSSIASDIINGYLDEDKVNLDLVYMVLAECTEQAKTGNNYASAIRTLRMRTLGNSSATELSGNIGFAQWAYAMVLELDKLAGKYISADEVANYKAKLKEFESREKEEEKRAELRTTALNNEILKCTADYERAKKAADVETDIKTGMRKDAYARNKLTADANNDLDISQKLRKDFEHNRLKDLDYRVDRLASDRSEATKDLVLQRSQELAAQGHNFTVTGNEMDNEFSLQKKEESMARQRTDLSLASIVNIGKGSDTEMDEIRLQKALDRGDKREIYEKMVNRLIAGVINVADFTYVVRQIMLLPISDKQIRQIASAYGSPLTIAAANNASSVGGSSTSAPPASILVAETKRLKDSLNRVEEAALQKLTADIIMQTSTKDDTMNLLSADDIDALTDAVLSSKKDAIVKAKNAVNAVRDKAFKSARKANIANAKNDLNLFKYDTKRYGLDLADAVNAVDPSTMKKIVMKSPTLSRMYKNYVMNLRSVLKNDEVDISSFINGGPSSNDRIPGGLKSVDDLKKMLTESCSNDFDREQMSIVYDTLTESFADIVMYEQNSIMADALDYAELSEAMYGPKTNLTDAEVRCVLEASLIDNDFYKQVLPYTTLKMKYYDKAGDETLIGVPDSYVRAPVAYGSVERDFKVEKERKFYQPLTLKITFKERYGDDKFADNELVAVIGILGSVIRVPSSEMEYILTSNINKDFASSLASDINKFGIAKGITSNFMGKLLGTKEVQDTIKNLPKSGELWDRLSGLSQKSVSGALAGKDAQMLVNAHLVFSMKEIENVKMKSDVDYLLDTKQATQLVKRYSAFSLAVVNNVTDLVLFFDDENNTGWNNVSLNMIKNSKTDEVGLLADLLKYTR